MLGTSWLGMMLVHEAGHVLHAWVSGGTVTKVVLGPLVISRTDVNPNPHPLFEIWGGPVWGCLVPSSSGALPAGAAPHGHILPHFSRDFV